MAESFASLVQSAAVNNGIPVSWMWRILNVENPSLNMYAQSYTGVTGLAQITQDTWRTVNGPNVPYSYDAAAQLNTEAKLLAKYQAQFGGNFALAAAAYNGGPGVSEIAQTLMDGGMPQAQAINEAAEAIYGSTNPAKVAEVNNYVVKATGQSAASLATQGASKLDLAPYLTDDGDPAVAVPVAGMTIPVNQLATIMNEINPPLVTDSEGLQRVPWYSNPNMVLPVQKQTDWFPVTFQLYFEKGSILPIFIALKASITTYNKEMKHITTHMRTRSGFRVNLWGMQPDQIIGTASTGLMMNASGVTDFLSLTTATDEIRAQVQKAFTDMAQESAMQQEIARPGSLRVAARDAFVELLSLFKNNGTVWFESQSYQGYTTGQQQIAADVWSPSTGSTTFQNTARRNDVMTRGKVIMNFRNSSYYGYFKSLNFMMDAKNPFQWHFDFVFQVEETRSLVRVPA